jgi:hypothetical protein
MEKAVERDMYALLMPDRPGINKASMCPFMRLGISIIFTLHLHPIKQSDVKLIEKSTLPTFLKD